MTYAAWEPRHRVTTVAPGKLDLFVATFLDGRLAAVQPVTEYDAALAKARSFLPERPCQIKVLPLSGREAHGFGLYEVATAPEPLSSADQALIRDTLLQVCHESSDADARADALDVLTTMGVIQP